MARPTKLTADLIAEITLDLEQGLPVWSVISARVNLRTYRRWIARGKRDERAKVDSLFRQLRHQVRVARARGQNSLIGQARKAARRNPDALIKLAERLYPDFAPPSLKREIRDLKATLRELEVAVAKQRG